MEEKGWQERSTCAMRCLDRRFGAWPDFVAANLLVDTAITTLLVAGVDSPYEPLRQRARKIQQEETAHWVHATGWVRRLGSPGLGAALATFWDDAFTWFGNSEDPVLSPLAAAGVLAETPDGLRTRREQSGGAPTRPPIAVVALGPRRATPPPILTLSPFRFSSNGERFSPDLVLLPSQGRTLLI
jgi:hypothetical protein